MKTRVKTSDLILDLIKANPSIAREEMAKALNLTIDGIDWNIRKLKKEENLNASARIGVVIGMLLNDLVLTGGHSLNKIYYGNIDGKNYQK